MAPMASNDTTPVARNTASLAFMDRGPVDRCFPAAKSLMGCKMDMVSESLSDGRSRGCPRIDERPVRGHRGPPGHNMWPQRTAI